MRPDWFECTQCLWFEVCNEGIVPCKEWVCTNCWERWNRLACYADELPRDRGERDLYLIDHSLCSHIGFRAPFRKDRK
jgi:hypothetical protein